MYARKELSVDNILSSITEYDIFRYYIPGFKTIGVPFRCELSEDNNPSCSIRVVNGKLRYKDFRKPGTVGAFNYIMEKYSLSFPSALELINRDFNLKLISKFKLQEGLISLGEPRLYGEAEIRANSYNVLKVTVRDWNNSYDKLYWNSQYDLSVKDLNFFDIYPISFIWIFNGEEWYSFGTAPVSYGYYGGLNDQGDELWKTYQPYEDRRRKWFTNYSPDYLPGYKQLPESGDLLLVTKSLKDVAVLRKAGYYSVAPNSESSSIPMSKMSTLKDRFKNIVVFYDNDTAGRLGAAKVCSTHGLESIFLPDNTAKDPSDYVAKFRYESLKEQIERQLRCGR